MHIVPHKASFSRLEPKMSISKTFRTPSNQVCLFLFTGYKIHINSVLYLKLQSSVKMSKTVKQRGRYTLLRTSLILV
jgi:hypothetical protein